MVRLRSPAPYGGFPEWPKGTDCKSAVYRLRWSESTIPHQKRSTANAVLLFLTGDIYVDSEARAHVVDGQKHAGGMFLGRGPDGCTHF